MPSLGPTTNSFSTHRKMDAIGLQRNTNKIKSFEGLRLEVGFDRICCSLLPRRIKTHQREHAHLLQVKGLPSHVKALFEIICPHERLIGLHTVSTKMLTDFPCVCRTPTGPLSLPAIGGKAWQCSMSTPASKQRRWRSLQKVANQR